MDIQAIIVGTIILAALAYVGQMLWRKTKSFSTKSSCAADCGCEGSRKSKVVKL